MISAKIVKDSWNDKASSRITTFELVYPRFLHSELLTHRVFSKNAASSRAIPIEKMIKMVEDNPAMPVFWGKNQSGMQAMEQVADVEAAEKAWIECAQRAVISAKQLQKQELHKQIVNRVLEPFMYITVLLTGTEFENMFALRAHKDAQPEFQVLAHSMINALNQSEPDMLPVFGWHIPFIRPEEEEWEISTKLQVSAARCARVSYLTHDGQNSSMEKDLQLYNRLAGSTPKHLSPLEHQACAMPQSVFYKNFRGWEQFRSLVE